MTSSASAVVSKICSVCSCCILGMAQRRPACVSTEHLQPLLFDGVLSDSTVSACCFLEFGREVRHTGWDCSRYHVVWEIKLGTCVSGMTRVYCLLLGRALSSFVATVKKVRRSPVSSPVQVRCSCCRLQSVLHVGAAVLAHVLRSMCDAIHCHSSGGNSFTRSSDAVSFSAMPPKLCRQALQQAARECAKQMEDAVKIYFGIRRHSRPGL